jgi:3D-(3,5/4)-trihydroxycyclohexane-1,2-dione acylhydrolase (decyclizing)
MDNADLLIAVGTRAVCQSDSSRTGYPQVKRVININADLEDATHYNHTLPLVGDVVRTLQVLNDTLGVDKRQPSPWQMACQQKKQEWLAFKNLRYENPVLMDTYWGETVLTQPAAVKIVTDWAKDNGFPCFLDAGDVQANGFQVAEDDTPTRTFTDTGASYMGFAVSALLATAVSPTRLFAVALTGDGSFTMNPQILIDGAEHGARGCITLFDNGRMGAITGLQQDQYQAPFATWNTVKIDYLAWARAVPGVLALDGGRSPEELRQALAQAAAYDGLSLIHLPVYYGPDLLGTLGVYGRWNVDNWSDNVQGLRHRIGL